MATTKTLKDNLTGKTYTFNFESEPTEQDLNDAIAHVQSIADQQPAQTQEQPQATAQEPKKANPLKRSLEGFYDRLQKRAATVDAPTTLGNMLGAQRGGVLGGAADAIGGLPERAARLGLGGFGSAADLIATPFIAAGGAINDATGGRLEKAVAGALQKTGIAPTIGNMAQKYDAYRQGLPASEQANLDATMSGLEGLAEFAGLGAAPAVAKAGARAAGGTVSAVGKGVEGAGKQILKGELKIEKPLARKVSSNLDKGKDKIVNTISKYNLESTTGNFDKMGEKANKLFSEKSKQADDLIAEYASKNPDKTVDLTDIFANVEKQIGKEIEIRPGEQNSALKTVSNIFDDVFSQVSSKGKDLSTLTPQDLVDIKRSIGAKYKNFDRSKEPVKEMIYDEIQSSIIKKINDLVPEAGKLNLEARDLKYAADAAEAASSRIANQNKGVVGGISDIVMASGGAGAALSNPDKALPIILGTAGAMATKRALGQGRGSAALMKTGKGLQQVGDAISLKNILEPEPRQGFAEILEETKPTKNVKSLQAEDEIDKLIKWRENRVRIRSSNSKMQRPKKRNGSLSPYDVGAAGVGAVTIGSMTSNKDRKEK